jgi:hypothetical protein
MDQHVTHVPAPVTRRGCDRDGMYARNTIPRAWKCLSVVLSHLKVLKAPAAGGRERDGHKLELPVGVPLRRKGLCCSTLGLVSPLFPTLLAYNVVLWIVPPGTHRLLAYNIVVLWIPPGTCCWHECRRWRQRVSTPAVPRFSTTDGLPRDHQPIPSTRRSVVLSTSRHYSTNSSIFHGALKRHSSFPAGDDVHIA